MATDSENSIKPLVIFLFLWLAMNNMNAQILFDASSNPNSPSWGVIDDVVMGGRSNGQLEMTKEGYARFFGFVSLENNGGFSSARYLLSKTKVYPKQTIRLRLKGDGKRFQFRVKNQQGQYYSYVQPFETDGEWQTLDFKLKDLYPTFRGRRLNLPNFNHNTIEEITFLIGNKKAQEFELLIASMEIID